MIRRTNKFSVGIWMITPSVMTSLLARDCPHSCLSNGEYSVASGAVMAVVWQVSRLTIGDRLQNVHQAGMIPRTGLYNLWCVKWNFLMCVNLFAKLSPIIQVSLCCGLIDRCTFSMKPLCRKTFARVLLVSLQMLQQHRTTLYVLLLYFLILFNFILYMMQKLNYCCQTGFAFASFVGFLPVNRITFKSCGRTSIRFLG